MNEEKRPGGWVDGVGWVAMSRDLNGADVLAVGLPPQHISTVTVAEEWEGCGVEWDYPVIVVRWADGTVPAAPSGDHAELVEKLRALGDEAGGTVEEGELPDWKAVLRYENAMNAAADALEVSHGAATPPDEVRVPKAEWDELVAAFDMPPIDLIPAVLARVERLIAAVRSRDGQ